MLLGMLVAFAPAVLAGCIIVYGTASEVVAILVLYHQAAAPWMGPFVVIGVIFLVIAVLRVAIQELSGTGQPSSVSVATRACTHAGRIPIDANHRVVPAIRPPRNPWL
jgi:hypothetical protein